MSEQENVQLVRMAYQKFLLGDLEGLLALFADDIEWELDAADNVPFSGVRRGKDEVMQFFDLLGKEQAALRFEPGEFIAQGDKVVALGHYAWNVKSTDRTYESDWAEVFTIRDGKIVRFREFANTAAAAAAYAQR